MCFIVGRLAPRAPTVNTGLTALLSEAHPRSGSSLLYKPGFEHYGFGAPFNRFSRHCAQNKRLLEPEVNPMNTPKSNRPGARHALPLLLFGLLAMPSASASLDALADNPFGAEGLQAGFPEPFASGEVYDGSAVPTESAAAVAVALAPHISFPAVLPDVVFDAARSLTPASLGNECVTASAQCEVEVNHAYEDEHGWFYNEAAVGKGATYTFWTTPRGGVAYPAFRSDIHKVVYGWDCILPGCEQIAGRNTYFPTQWFLIVSKDPGAGEVMARATWTDCPADC